MGRLCKLVRKAEAWLVARLY